MFLRSLRFSVATALMLVAFGTSTVLANPANGCEDAYFQSGFFGEDNKRVFREDLFQVFTLRMGAPAFEGATGETRKPDPVTFDQKLLVTDPGVGTQRLRVRTLADKDIGWMEREDLLCRTLPLADAKSGLLRRTVIQTETAVQGKSEARLAYHAPDGRCEGGKNACPKLSRFQWYFVYAEENGHILLSEAANLGGRDARLVGWLPESDGISWNSAVALRPVEQLETRKGPDGTGEAHVCAYPTMASVGDKKSCRPILGGKRWFKIETRLPILQDHGKTYEVALTSAATTGTFEEALSISGVAALANVDLFFVIDGTKSMQSAIDAIKGKPGYPGLVDQIRSRIAGKLKQGAVLRYGFRIYRDSVKGGSSGTEDDGMPLGPDCVSNEAEFVRRFADVRAFDPNDDRDYPENVAGGLMQASRDMASCPDHLKLVVLIGDHGYDANAQRQRGHQAYTADTVIQRFVRGRRLNTQPVVLVIQTKSDPASATNPDVYSRSYEEFRSQGLEFLRGVYASIQKVGAAGSVKPEDYFFRLDSQQVDAAMIDRIITPVDQMLQPEIVGRLAQRLKGGESLVDAITAMQAGDKSSVPVLYWNVIADALCKRLGNQCTKQVLEGVFRGYIPHSPDLTHDVLLSREQLQSWREVLGRFKMFWSMLRSGGQSRDRLVNVLTESIGTVLKLDIDDRGKSIGEFAQFVGGLPHGASSKLMAYSPAALRDEATVKQCEIQHLVNYASKKADVLQIALDGDKLAEFNQETLPVAACPTLTDKGKVVPHLPGSPRPRALNAASGNTDYTFSFRRGNERYYWVPVDYLP